MNFPTFAAFNGIIRERTEKPLICFGHCRESGVIKEEREALHTLTELQFKAAFHREDLFKNALDQDKGTSAAFSTFPQRHAGSKQSRDAPSPLQRCSFHPLSRLREPNKGILPSPADPHSDINILSNITLDLAPLSVKCCDRLVVGSSA